MTPITLDSLTAERKKDMMDYFTNDEHQLTMHKDGILEMINDAKQDDDYTYEDMCWMAFELKVVELAIEYVNSPSAKAHRTIIQECCDKAEKYRSIINVPYSDHNLSNAEQYELYILNKTVGEHDDAMQKEGWDMVMARLG